MADAFVACAFFMPECGACGGGRPLCPRRGQPPLSEVGSGPLPEMGSGTLSETGSGTLPAVGSDPIGDCDISALALYSALFYNSWCW